MYEKAKYGVCTNHYSDVTCIQLLIQLYIHSSIHPSVRLSPINVSQKAVGQLFRTSLGGVGGRTKKRSFQSWQEKEKWLVLVSFWKSIYFGWWPSQTFKVKQETYKYNLVYFAILIMWSSIMLMSMSMSNFLHNIDSQAGPKGCGCGICLNCWVGHSSAILHESTCILYMC